MQLTKGYSLARIYHLLVPNYSNRRLWRRSLWCGIILCALTSCIHSEKMPVKLGIQPDYISYVPARIGVLNCQRWPDGARYQDQPLSNISQKAFQALCTKFDRFVILGFKEQPFMRGLSPKVVNKILELKKKPNFLSEIKQLWGHKGDACHQCTDPISYYRSSIAPRSDWQVWLNRFSKLVKYADAILMPLVIYGVESSYVERGLNAKAKQAEIVLLLIDTNNGHLLWVGHRRSKVVNKGYEHDDTPQDVLLPPWGSLYERLFTDDIWQEFPGRQVY